VNEIKPIQTRDAELKRDSDGAQLVVVPAELELPEGEFVLVRDGDRLIVEPKPTKKPQTFADMLAQMETIDVEWPDIDEGLLPLDDINLE
jgi:antitoxin VapB